MSSLPASPNSPTPPFARRKNGKLEQWVCSRCGYVYDGNAGDPPTHAPPGTPFETLPASWHCPHCAAEKRYFFY